MSETATPEDACREFGEFLGVGDAVSPTVLRAALADPVYARKLVGSRGAPDAVRYLLARPPAVRDGASQVSDANLARHAAKALARWVFAGMKRVDEATYARRTTACQSCEFFKASGDSALYALVGGAREGVCGQCGCVATSKASMPTESCPSMDPARPGFTRWGELMT
ncbi:MAG: hypothetical protein ABJE47_16490 [bacterium]